MADYPYPCRSKGTKTLPIDTNAIDNDINGRLYGVQTDSDHSYFRITSINTNLTLAQKTAILDHYKDITNLLTEFNWVWNTDDSGSTRTFVAMYIGPPKPKWTKNNRWTVTTRLHGYDTEY